MTTISKFQGLICFVSWRWSSNSNPAELRTLLKKIKKEFFTCYLKISLFNILPILIMKWKNGTATFLVIKYLFKPSNVLYRKVTHPFNHWNLERCLRILYLTILWIKVTNVCLQEYCWYNFFPPEWWELE